MTSEQKINRQICNLCTACAKACPTGALEICGEAMTVADVLSVVEKDTAFYGEAGGITLSGGEPLVQGDGVVALLQACKTRGLHTVIETCGYAEEAMLRKVVPWVDLWLWDIKDTCDERHKQYTGVSNHQILSNLAVANALGAKVRLRCILVNGVNTCDSHYRRIAEIAQGLCACEGVEFIPYHAYGGTKAVFLGGEDNGRADWIPAPEQLASAKNILTAEDIHVFP